MGRKKAATRREIEIGTLFDYKLQDVTLPPSLDPVIYPRMTLNTAKAWFLLLSMVEETTAADADAGVITYTFPALDFAKRMNMSQPRGEEVRNALRPLTKINFSTVEGDLTNIENARTLDTNLLMAVEYQGNVSGKPLAVDLHPKVNSAIYETKKAIQFDYDDAAKLTTLNAIHTFTALTRLKNQGICQLPVEEFKTVIGLSGRYSQFSAFKRAVLVPVQNDIRSNTTFKFFRFLYDGSPDTAKGKRMAVKNIGFSFDEPLNITEEAVSFAGFLYKDEADRIKQFSNHTQQVILELCKKRYATSQYLNLIIKAISDTSESDFCVCCEKIFLEVGSGLLNDKYGKILTKNLKELKKRPKKKTAATVDVNGMAYADQQKWLNAYQDRAKSLIKSMPLEKRRQVVKENIAEIKAQVNNISKFDERDILGMKIDCRRTAVKAMISFLSKQYYTGKRRVDDDMRWEPGTLFGIQDN